MLCYRWLADCDIWLNTGEGLNAAWTKLYAFTLGTALYGIPAMLLGNGVFFFRILLEKESYFITTFIVTENKLFFLACPKTELLCQSSTKVFFHSNRRNVKIPYKLWLFILLSRLQCSFSSLLELECNTIALALF
ncbi:hypothetical protein Droror1_Dr00009706 [Drosera rotundifolia]